MVAILSALLALLLFILLGTHDVDVGKVGECMRVLWIGLLVPDLRRFTKGSQGDYSRGNCNESPVL